MKTKSILCMLLLFVSTIIFAQNSITPVSFPTTVTASSNVDVTFDYTKDAAVASAHIFIRLKDNITGNLSEVNKVVTTSTGTLTLSLPIPNVTPGSNYFYQVQMFLLPGYSNVGVSDNLPDVVTVEAPATEANSITMINPPTTVTAGTSVDITFNYTKDVARGHAFIRFIDASGELSVVDKMLTANSGTETLSLLIPANAVASGGYSYQAQIFNPDAGYDFLAQQNISGITVVTTAPLSNSITMISPPTTVTAATMVDITFDYTKDVVEAWAFIRFKDASGNLTEVSKLLTANSGTETLPLEIPLASVAGDGYSYQAQLFTTEWAHLVTQNITGITVLPAVATEEIIAAGENWKYYDAGNEPTGNWKTAGFDDASWTSGNAEFGYGEGDETTVINSSTITAYFRKSFNVTNEEAAFPNLTMNALRDDGMIVYINGTEVWRDNMPSGAVNYGTFSSFAAPEGIWINKISTNFLVEGTNMIAVEIHQNIATSSDISFDFSLNVSEDINAELRRGPYLQKGSSDAITIKYRTNGDTQTIINYGTSLGDLNNTVADNTLKIDHEIEITGLSPNTKYYYEIANNSEVYVTESSDMYFLTAPPVGTDQFVRAWILGDAGTGDQNQKNVRDQYYNYVTNASTNPDQTDMMLFLGDNAYENGSDAEYQYTLFDIYEEQLMKTVAWSTIGNHDGYSADSNTQTGPYYDIFSLPTAAEVGGIASGTEAYYSFDYANIHFIVLESNTLDDNATQIAWCTQDIQNTNQDWIIAFFHHPPYSKGGHDSDVQTQLVNMRQNFLPILEANGVDLVLAGHSHSYERSYFMNGHYDYSGTFDLNTHTVGTNGHLSGKADTSDGAYLKTQTQNPGAVYVTSGSAGKTTDGPLNHNANYFSLKELGSSVLEIESDGETGQNLTIKFIRDNGTVPDYFTINKTGITLSTETNTQDINATKVYPVPVDSLLNIKVSANEWLKEVKIYNAVGKLVKTTTRSQINVNNIPSGIYVVQIITDKSENYKSIIIK